VPLCGSLPLCLNAVEAAMLRESLDGDSRSVDAAAPAADFTEPRRASN
jgi:hypothetical protein